MSFYVGVAHINAQLIPFVLLSGVQTDSFTRGLSGSRLKGMNGRQRTHVYSRQCTDYCVHLYSRQCTDYWIL